MASPDSHRMTEHKNQESIGVFETAVIDGEESLEQGQRTDAESELHPVHGWRWAALVFRYVHRTTVVVSSDIRIVYVWVYC